MENNKETVLVTSSFDAPACHKLSLVIYMLLFSYSFAVGASALEEIVFGFLIGVIGLLIGSIVHLSLYLSLKNNKIILTNYSITGVYNRHMSLNIPIDSVSSVSKGRLGSLCITCAGNKYNISFVGNRDDFCVKINELLNERARRSLKDEPENAPETDCYYEIMKMKQLLDDGIITQDEFEAKKKQLLEL